MVTETLEEISLHYKNILDALKDSDTNLLEKTYKKLKALEEYGFKLRAQSIRYIKSLSTAESKPAELMLYSTDLLQDITNSCLALSEECLHYIKNLHREPDKEFMNITDELKAKMSSFIATAISVIKENKTPNIEQIRNTRDQVRAFLNQHLDSQVLHIQQNKPGVKQALLQTSILLQSRDILAVTLRILKMYRKYQ